MNHRKFTINQRLPSMNEIVNANRNNRFGGAKLKKDADTIVWHSIQAARADGELYPVTRPCKLSCLFHLLDKHRRDLDNMAAGAHKSILDGLVKQGILPDDSIKWVTALEDRITIDGTERIEVWIEEEGQ